MKVNGIQLTDMRIVKIYLPVQDDQAVEFKFRPLRSGEQFEKVMTKPKPPVVKKPGGVEHFNTDDDSFKLSMADWFAKKMDWEFLASISATDGLEWESVKMDDPESWKKWRDDASKVFGESACSTLFNSFIDAQYITEETMEKARARFLIGREGQPG